MKPSDVALTRIKLESGLVAHHCYLPMQLMGGYCVVERREADRPSDKGL